MQKIQLKNKTFEQINYYKTGSGPALMLVHGFPANAQLWRYIYPELSKYYTILLPDFFSDPGAWMNDNMTSMELLSNAFKDILDHEQIEQAVLAGHSMGGYMGLAFARNHPNRLKGLSLIHSSALADDQARLEGRQKSIKIIEQGGKGPFLRKMVIALFPDKFNKEHPDIAAKQLEEALNVPVESLLAFYKAIMLRTASTDFIKDVSFPLQYIIGQSDSLSNIQKDLATDTLTNTNFVSVFPNCGHMCMLEAPEILLRDLHEFAAYCFSQK